SFGCFLSQCQRLTGTGTASYSLGPHASRVLLLLPQSSNEKQARGTRAVPGCPRLYQFLGYFFWVTVTGDRRENRSSDSPGTVAGSPRVESTTAVPAPPPTPAPIAAPLPPPAIAPMTAPSTAPPAAFLAVSAPRASPEME